MHYDTCISTRIHGAKKTFMARDRARRDRYAAIFTERALQLERIRVNVDSDISDDRGIIIPFSPFIITPKYACYDRGRDCSMLE